MKKTIKSVLAVLCVIAMLATAIPVSFAANENDNHLLYGRKQLQKSSESNALTEAYDRIVEGIANREESIILSDLSIKKEELVHIVSLYRNDPHPHFWLGNTYSYSGYPDGTVYAFMPGYNELGTVSDDEFKKEINLFNSEIDAIIKKAGIKKGMSQYDIELNIHNTLVKEFDYIKTTNAHNAYGAIVEKEAVCQGYTLAYNYLLRLCGIEAHYVAGTSRDIPHAWSLVSIDGEYYYTDITWDDPSGTYSSCREVFHSYFNVSYSTLTKDHTFNEISYDLPLCNGENGSFFAHNPERIMTANPDVKLVASLFREGSAAVYVPENLTKAFTSWYNNNIHELATLAGYDMTKGISYLYVNSGSEFHLIIEGTLLEPVIKVILGDVDGDGSVTGIDSNILRRIVSGSMSATEINLLGGDMDGDKKLTSVDSNLLKRLVAGN